MNYTEKIREFRNDAQERQSAIKIIDKLKELKSKNDNISSYRWIWELIQNAKDCANSGGYVDICIEYNKKNQYVEFKHNGKLFSTKNIVYLIEQVSTKERNILQEEKTTGKFGTGFLTTHLLSEKVTVSGCLQDDEDIPVEFSVNLDRSGQDLNSVIQSIKNSCDELEKNTNPMKKAIDEKGFNTCFKYMLHNNGMDIAENGLNNFLVSAPYVFSFVSQINSITIINDGQMTKYTKLQDTQTGLSNSYVCQLIINSRFQRNYVNIFTLTNDNVSVAVQINQDCFNKKNIIVPFDSKLPKIFCDFPLLGTETFSFPVVVNSPLFYPNEPRSGILLNGSLPETSLNKDILYKACNLYIDLINYFVKKEYEAIYNVTSIPNLVELDWLDKDWINTRILEYIKLKLCRIKMIKNIYGIKKTIYDEYENFNILIPSNPDINTRYCILNLAKEINPERMVNIEEAEFWYNSLWEECHNYDISKLMNDIENFGNLNELSQKVNNPIAWLNNVINLLSKNSEFFQQLSSAKIFPNQKGELCCISDLYLDGGIEEAYKDVALIIGIDYKAKLLDKKINYKNPFLKRLLFYEVCDEMLSKVAKTTNIDTFYEEILGLSINNNIDELVYLYNEYYSFQIPITKVSKIYDKLLNSAKVYILDKISKDISFHKLISDITGLTKNNCISWISRFIKYIIDTKQERLLYNYSIIPNQAGQLKKLSELKKELNKIPNFLKDVCERSGKNIREELIMPELSYILPNNICIEYDTISTIITNFIRKNKNQNVLNYDNGNCFYETYTWLIENKENSLVKHHFSELLNNLHWFYNDEIISKNMTFAKECNSILKKYGLSNIDELEKVLQNNISDVSVKGDFMPSIEEVLCQYGITDATDLKNLIDGKILSPEFIHYSSADKSKFEYVQGIIKRTHDNIYKYLNTLEEYDLSETVDVHKTIFTVKKNGKEIYIIARPSDYNQIVLYYGAEIDILDYTQDFELWVENGKDNPEKLTFGKILRLTGVNRIPLRRIL